VGKSSSTVDTIVEKTFENSRGLEGYPTPQTLLSMNAAIVLMIKEFNESESLKSETDHINGKYYYDLSAQLLAEALFDFKCLYRKNGLALHFEHGKLLSDETLKDQISKRINAEILQHPYTIVNGKTKHRVVPKITEPWMLTKNAGIQLMHGIETHISIIDTYYNPFITRKLSKDMERFLRRETGNIAEYAQALSIIADIADGLREPVDAALMRSVGNTFENNDTVLKKITTIDNYNMYSTLLTAHCGLMHSPIPSDLWMLVGEYLGEEISAFLDLADDIRGAVQMMSYARSHPNTKKAYISTGNRWYNIDNVSHIIRLLEKEGEVAAVGSLVSNGNAYALLSGRKGVFKDLEHKLNGTDVPFYLVKGVGMYLDNILSGRTFPTNERISLDKTVKAFHLIGEKNLYPEKKSVDNKRRRKEYKTVKKYINGAWNLVAHTVGKSPRPIAYLFNRTEDEITAAPGIAPIIYLTNTLPDGTIEHVHEIFSMRDCHEASALRMAKKLFGNNDVYVRTNQGAAFLLDQGPILELVNPDSVHIDVRDAFSMYNNRNFMATTGLDKLSKFKSDYFILCKGHVDLHEIVHEEQVDSRLIWREIATTIAQWMMAYNIRLHEEGRSDQIYPSTYRLPDMGKGNNKTWRDEIAEAVELYGLPALATGNKGRLMRNNGYLSTIHRMKMGLPVTKYNDINMDIFRKLKFEDSYTANLVHNAIELIRKGSIEEMIQMHTTLKNHSQDLLSVLEHTAEAFSFEAIRLYFNNYPDKRVKKDTLDDYLGRLKQNIESRGILATHYQNIIKVAKNDKERDYLLAEKGMKYVKYFSNQQDWEVEKRLVCLGYDPFNPCSAYNNMSELKRMAKQTNIPFGDLLINMNGSKAMLGLRYDTGLEDYDTIIRSLGAPKAFKRILLAESSEEIRNLASQLRDKNQ